MLVDRQLPGTIGASHPQLPVLHPQLPFAFHWAPAPAVVAAVVLISLIGFSVPDEHKYWIAGVLLAVLIFLGLAVGDFHAVTRVGLALVLAFFVGRWALHKADPGDYESSSRANFYFLSFVGVFVWNLLAGPSPPLWQDVLCATLPLVAIVAAVSLGRERHRHEILVAEREHANAEEHRTRRRLEAERRQAEEAAAAERRRELEQTSPSLSTSGETLTIEESMTLRARTETAGHVGDEHEWS